MNVNVPRPPGAVPWGEVRGRLDQNAPFANMFRHPALSRRGVGAVFPRGICAPLCGAAGEDARAQDTAATLTSGCPDFPLKGMKGSPNRARVCSLCARYALPFRRRYFIKPLILLIEAGRDEAPTSGSSP
jgi:hypothetical protein